MKNYFRLLGALQIASILLLSITSLVIAQSVLKSIGQEKKCNLKQVLIEETWRGFSWTNNVKLTKAYDTNYNCISQMKEVWNGTKWEPESLEKSSYDKLHRKVSNEFYKWNKKAGKGELVNGTRDVIDTVNNKSNRLVLYDAVWDPDKKYWAADDSEFYDKTGKIIKSVDKNITVSDITGDTLVTIETSENNYQSDKVWVETNKKWRSDSKKTEMEKYRYRQIKIIPIQCYSIDYWDEKMNRWIVNTAQLFKINSNKVEVDSIEEIIDDKSVPVYVSFKVKDDNGNILTRRYWSKSKNEVTGKWDGTYFKWERNYSVKQNRFFVAESMFVANTSGTGWQLKSYQNEICKTPSAGKIIEYGNYEKKLNLWSYERSFDTLTSCGIVLAGEEYFDEEKREWMPTVRFNSIQNSDSIVITTELLDMGSGEWGNDSMFVVRRDRNGNVLSRLNYVWTKTGMLNAEWIKANRQTYFYAKE